MNLADLHALRGRLAAGLATMRGIFAVAVLCLIPQASAVQPTQTQVIPLNPGWNLISIQVGGAVSPASFTASLDFPNNLIEIWGFNTPNYPSTAGAWNSYQPKIAGFPSDLANLQPGRGYWVNVSQYCQATLTGISWDGTLAFNAGWNLVGFPGVARAASEAQDPASVFGNQFSRVSQIYAFDSSPAQRFLGYDLTTIPQVKTLTSIDPGKGYWVYALEPFSIAPGPYIALPADSDAAPLQIVEPFSEANGRYLGNEPARYVGRNVRFRGATDIPYDLNGNGIIDEAETQDTILFEIASNVTPVTIGNRGAGAVTWVLDNTVPWLFTAPADERVYPNNVGRPKTASGTVSSDRDTLLLYVDRRGMSPGRISGQSCTLYVGGVPHVIRLLVDIAQIDGDWRGFATTTRVGGKDISLGEVRLAFNVFRPEETAGIGGFRAVLNREQAILFPRDVYMEGVFFSGNQFKLTTNFEMPAGDRNAPPYSTFQHTQPSDFPGDPAAAARKAARGDKDFNRNGRVDVMNPFPFGLRREITLIGTRVTPDRLEGTYIEAIRGMLPPSSNNPLPGVVQTFLSDSFLTTSQPIFIEGTFVLERQSFTPTKRSVFDQTTQPGVTVGGSSSGSRNTVVTVDSNARIQGVTVQLGLNLGNIDPALFRITLVSPSGTAYILHDYAAILAGTYTIPRSIFQGESAQGEWTLVIEWDSTAGERATLASFGLQVEGVSAHTVTGRLVRNGTSTGLGGIEVRVEGSVLPVSIVTQATGAAGDIGKFTTPELSENDYSLVIRAPGYLPQTVTFFVGEQDIALGEIALTPESVTVPTIRAAPALGYEPLNTDFEMLVPEGYGATQITWNFGDGTAVQSGALNGTLIAPPHVYEAAGDFTPIATLSGGSLGTPLVVTGQSVHVERRRPQLGVGAPTQQVIAGIFLGSVGARMDAGATTSSASAFPSPLPDAQTVFTDEAGTVTIPSATVYQESQWDSASFDLDRVPYGTTNWAVSSTKEDTDFGRAGSISPGIGQVFIFYNSNAVDNAQTATDEKWDARAWGTTPQVAPFTPLLPALPATDLYQSSGIYAVYTPANPARPDRLRFGVTLGGAVLGTAPSPAGDVFIFPGRTLRGQP